MDPHLGFEVTVLAETLYYYVIIELHVTIVVITITLYMCIYI